MDYSDWRPHQHGHLMYDSLRYHVIIQKRAVKNGLRATPLIPDLMKLVIEYTKPATDILNRIRAVDFVYKDTLTDSIVEYKYKIVIVYKISIERNRSCGHCYEYCDHVCITHALNGNSRWHMPSIPLSIIIEAACTGDVKKLKEYMYAESGDKDIETGLTGAQLDIYHDEMTHVAHAAALEFVNYLIW